MPMTSHRRPPLRLQRRGYVMLVALVLLALIGVVGTTSLKIAGADQRIAQHNAKHMMVFNTSVAGTEHARIKLSTDNPYAENVDSSAPDSGDWVSMSSGDTKYGGTSYAQNLGVYWVEAVFERCGNPPPGYSTEQGRNGYRSDYWSMSATARMTDSTFSSINNTQATSVATIRKVMPGACKVR
ncbi:MAG: hypothetical protein VX899_18925 [Myxococcota bacterium]|nr:hypothetical protein [Myxococcota bacterium]